MNFVRQESASARGLVGIECSCRRVIYIVDKKVFLSRCIWIYFTRLKNSGEPNYKYAIYLWEMWSRHNKSRMSWFISFLPEPVLIHFTFEDNFIEKICVSHHFVLWTNSWGVLNHVRILIISILLIYKWFSKQNSVTICHIKFKFILS